MPAEKPVVDYTKLNPAQFLAALDDDAMKWAEAFCQLKKSNGWALDDIDESLMVGWFANAIEKADMVRQEKRSKIPAVRNAESLSLIPKQ